MTTALRKANFVVYNITHPVLEHKVEKLPPYILGKTPANFDPECFPIIARHVFGIEPPSFGAAYATIVADPHYRRQVEQLHEQGPRPVGEFLAELAIEHGIQSKINAKLSRYAQIPDVALDRTGTREFPPLPMYGVSR